MSLHIETFPAGPIATNAYLVVDTESHDAIVIDAPPGSLAAIQGAAIANQATVRAVVLTHGHWDHIVDTEALREAFHVPVMAHQKVIERVISPAVTSPVPIPASTVDTTLDEGDLVTVGAFAFTVWFLPGHDEGHIALVSEADNVFLGGDVLFPNGHGRTDIPGSDQTTMESSLKRLLALPDAMVVYPGHGQPTTIGQERDWMTAMTGQSGA